MRNAGASWFTIIPAAVAVAPAPLQATVYMSVAQAQQAMFPGAKFADRSITFTDAQRKMIARASGTRDFARTQHIWDARNGGGRAGWFILDRVIGKHEYITYAVALTPEGVVKRVEILEYRETYGGEVRSPAWRQQFVGKHFGSQLKLGSDIKNISGATLSSRHITDGIRRLLATYELLLKNG
ncbi:MAG TPA: FMN-binding protein [Sphingomicrobium sp.]|nr:FMN-binding protein [Sphingomicrobium sp.]